MRLSKKEKECVSVLLDRERERERGEEWCALVTQHRGTKNIEDRAKWHLQFFPLDFQFKMH